MDDTREAVKAERLEKAFAMFDEGKSVNAVGAAVFNNFWRAANEAKQAWLAANPEAAAAAAAPKPAKKKKAKRAAKLKPAETETEAEEEPEEIECSIRIPIGRADDIFAEFSAIEKCAAIQCVLQDRMNAALAS